MIQNFIRKLIPILKGEFLIGAPLRSYTTFRIGGPADLIVFPRFLDDIPNVLNLINEFELPFIIIGNGSNLLVKDEGYHGIVISLKKYFNTFEIKDETIEVESGTLINVLSHKAYENGLSGLEFACSIPATIGGAIHNNAGAYGECIGNILKEIEIINKAGELKKINSKDMIFSYRNCKLPEQGIIIKAVFTLIKDEPDNILKKIEKNVENRMNAQPYNFPSAGSIFKNPQGDSAGRLIEQAGLKGKSFGNAQISEKHANFIINKGEAKASDVINLIELIQKEIYEKFGIKLETEIEIVG